MTLPQVLQQPVRAQWVEEFEPRNRRDPKHAHWVYWRAGSIHTGARSEHSDGQCLLVSIGVKSDGSRKRVAIAGGYRELEQSMLGMELTLRSRTVEGVYRESWGTLIACNLIRREIACAAVTPAYAKLPACLQRLRERLKSLPNEKRPGRACERVVKSRPEPYTVRYLKKLD